MSFNTTRRVLLLVLAATVLTADAGAAEKFESTFTSYEMVLDGDPVDWQGFPIAYLEDSLHVMSIAHDGNNLYLMYRFADHGLARRLLMRGVTLWINGDGKTKKKNEEFAVRYPGSEQIAEQFEDEDSWQGRSRPDETGTTGRGGPPPSLASMRQVPGRLTVIRMGMKETVDENDPDGPTAASAHNKGVFCYELKIPFAAIGGTIADTSSSKKRKVAIGIQIGGMTEAEMEMLEAAMKEKMGETGGMGGSRGGGGMGGGRSGGSMGGMGGMGGSRGGGAMGSRGGDTRSRMNPEIEWLSVTLPPNE